MRNRVSKSLRRKVNQAGGSRRGYRLAKRAWHTFPRRDRNPLLRGYWLPRAAVERMAKAAIAEAS